MEKRLLPALFLFIIAFSPTVTVCAGTLPETGALHPLENFDIWVSALSHYSFTLTGCQQGGRIYGSFTVTSGSEVTFFICDETTYDSWADGVTVSVYEQHIDVGSLTYDFTVPYDGTWRVVLYNDAWFSSRHVEGTLNYSAPAAQFLPFALLMAVGVVVLGGIVVCSRRRKSPTRMEAPAAQTYASQSYVAVPPSQVPVAYCPSCGAPTRSPQDKFCASCGKPLPSGPDLG